MDGSHFADENGFFCKGRRGRVKMMLAETDNFSGFFAQNINFFKLKFRVFLEGNVEQVP